jgi:hypothetical protein
MIQNSKWLKLASCALAAVAWFSSYAYAQRGALTVSRGLDQLSEDADVIVRGHVASAKVEPHPQLKNLMTVVISFTVQDTLKGRPQKSIEFRQYIWDLRDQLDAARYLKGEELLLMLGPVSSYGLRSPVGLDQGRFRITRDQQGQALALNGRGNVGLFQSVEQRAQTRGLKLSTRQIGLVRQPQPGPVPLADLEDAIRTFAGTK